MVWCGEVRNVARFHGPVLFRWNGLGMDKSDDACIDIKSLATCLRGKLENLYPLSEDCCIYRVPSKLRNSKGSPGTPQIVSIGPLHHGREELKAMEEYKLRYSKRFLQHLFELAKTKEPNECYDGLSISKLVSPFCGDICELLSIDESLFEINFSRAKHFVDLVRLCIEPSDHQFDIEIETIRTPTLPTITELHRAGVKFEVGSNKHIFDIMFDKIKGTMEIPKSRLSNVSSYYFKNLQMFETLHCETNHVNDYAMFISLLVSSPKDAELLIQNGILENTGSVAASTFCGEIGNQARVSYNRFYYIDLARDLNDYCKSPWRKWNANLKQNYFNSPWATISVIAANYVSWDGVSPDVYLFSIVINAFCKGDRIEDAVRLFTKMEELGVAPNVVTFNNMIHEAIKLFDGSKRNGIGPNVYIYGVMINGYCKADKTEEGEKLFNELISTKVELGSTVYNTLISVCCKNGNIEAAFRLLDDMRSRGIPPTSGTYSSLIHGMCNLGLVEDAQSIFEEIRKEGVLPNVVCYTALIGNMKEAAKLLYEMAKNGIVQDDITYIVFMNRNCKEGNMEEVVESEVEGVDSNEMKRPILFDDSKSLVDIKHE
ncbi:hypothetical protein EZV62_006937 [Acer yangbiense]|uniref:Uncharacterized protein n=1 Tax=Acer yangbiense TaxID=1000413 RepID=A0A5C7IAF0_9ROSI|nr:hypothetical protein EZV62_006937 [Acer yangbiense]